MTYGNYQYDLYVYHPTHDNATTGGGNNGSNHFITTFGYQEPGNSYMPDDDRPIFSFEGQRNNAKKKNITAYR